MKSDLSMKAAVYLRAAELIEIGHCKNALARDITGKSIGPLCQDAIAWCWMGALMKASFELDTQVVDYKVGHNDLPETTQAQVAARLREEAFK